MQSLETSNWGLAKSMFLGALTVIGVPFDIFMLLVGFSVLDTAAGATLAVRLRIFSGRELLLGMWVKLLYLSTAFLFSLGAQKLGYDNAKVASDGFIIVMIVQEFFSATTSLRGIKLRKKLKQIDLLSIFFDTFKKIVIDQINKWKPNGDIEGNSEEGRG